MGHGDLLSSTCDILGTPCQGPRRMNGCIQCRLSLSPAQSYIYLYYLQLGSEWRVLYFSSHVTKLYVACQFSNIHVAVFNSTVNGPTGGASLMAPHRWNP